MRSIKSSKALEAANRASKTAIRVIGYKIEEIQKQDRRFQVSTAFRKRHALKGYIEMLESKRTSFEDDIRQLDQKSQSSNIVITGNNTSNTGTQNASSSSSVPPSATQSDDIRAVSSFEGGLADIAEGEVFKNDRGEYYQKVNGAARKIDKSDYDRMEANRIAAQMASREAERQERDAAFSRAAEDLTTLGANALMSIRADREARLDREYVAQSRAEEILKSYKSLAGDGNIEALKKVNNAYYTLAYYNKEEKGGWTGRYSVERETFLKNTANNTGSPGAQELLVDFYESQKDQAISRQNKAIYRGIAYPLLGGGLFYGGYKIYDSILQDDDGSQEWLGTTMLSIGVVSGLTSGLWGFYEALSATPLGAYAGRKSAGYKEADAKQ